MSALVSEASVAPTSTAATHTAATSVHAWLASVWTTLVNAQVRDTAIVYRYMKISSNVVKCSVGLKILALWMFCFRLKISNLHLVALIGRHVASLERQGGEELSKAGPKFFKLCPIVVNYVQHYFPGGQKVSRGFPPYAPSWLRTC